MPAYLPASLPKCLPECLVGHPGQSNNTNFFHYYHHYIAQRKISYLENFIVYTTLDILNAGWVRSL